MGSTNKAGTVAIAFRGTEEYREKLKHAALARKIQVQEMIERALEVYLKGDPAAEIAAQREARANQAPEGHQLIAVPNEIMDLIEPLVELIAKDRGLKLRKLPR